MQEFMPYLLGLLQWARAQKRFSEWWYAGIVFVSALGFALLANPNLFSLPFGEIFAAWRTNLIAILAATQGISTSANLIDSLRKPSHSTPALLPVTNSQP